MKRKNLYLSTIDKRAGRLAQQHGLGLEIAEFCAAYFLDDRLPKKDPVVRNLLTYSDRFLLHGPYSELFPCAIDPKVRDVARLRYQQSIEAAQRYGAKKVILHAGFNSEMYYPIWFTRQSIQFWRNFEIPEDITVCLENVREDTPEILLEILQAVDKPNLRMCLDIGHANVHSKVPPLDWIKTCAPVLDHFHVHNNDGSVDSHQPLTEGNIPIMTLLQEIDWSCPDATVTLELMDGEASVQWLNEQNIWEK